MAALRSSGDLLADRRYVWAEAALAEGDAAAAADLAAQVLERAPAYGPAWLLLGRAREVLAGDEAGRGGAAPPWIAGRSLADWSTLWDKLGRLADETERLNLDRKQAVLTGLGWLPTR